MLLRYTQESAQPFIYKGYALFISKLEIIKSGLPYRKKSNPSVPLHSCTFLSAGFIYFCNTT